MKLKKYMKILVVEDSPEAVELFKHFLKKGGLENVITCPDGESAWILIRRSLSMNEPIELLLVDWNMPGLNGFELLKRVRKSKNFENVPFVMVTGDGDPARVKEAIDAGVDNYLLKPMTAKTLMEKIEIAFKNVKNKKKF